MNKEVQDNNLKKIMLVIIAIMMILIIGILIFEGISNSKLSNDEENEMLNNVEEEKEEQDDNEINQDNEVKDDEKEDINDIDEATKKELYFEILNYISSISLFNKNDSCQNNIITEDCLDDISKMKIIFYSMSKDSAFSERQYDEETSSFIHFAYFSTIRQYEKELFGANKIEFPDGKEFGKLFCSTYEKMNDSYKISNSSSACSVDLTNTSEWYFNNKGIENDIKFKENTIYLDVEYYYIYKNDLNNEPEKFCIDDSKENCVESLDKLDKAKLRKARYIFDYTDNKLKFNSIEIFNLK